MPEEETRDSMAAKPQAVFATTRWSEVLAAGQVSGAGAEQALARLCENYWYPLYAFVRLRGLSPEDAQDSTQEFFSRLLARNWLRDADRNKGRFRTFLLTALTRFLANEWDRAHTQKRGGVGIHLSLDASFAEGRYLVDTKTVLPPDRLYDRQWALTLLQRALSQLESEQPEGKCPEFAVLRSALTLDRGDIPYTRIAAVLKVSEPAARMAVHRLRKRFRQLFREEIAQTVADPKEVEEEIHHLIAALAE